MTQARWMVGAVVATGALALAGCSSSPSTSSTTTSAAARSTTTTPPPTPSTTTSEASSSSAASTAAAGAVNVAVTDQIRAELVAAGAAVNGIPVAQYTGLAPGLTFLALDRATNTYWAGARLVPAPSSDPSSPTRAQVASQDDGSYYVFTQPAAGGVWTAHATGASGPGTPCPVSVPAAVTQVWGWPSGGCRAPGA